MQLPPALTSVAEARSVVGTVAGEHGLDEGLVGDAALVVSELVTNAVLHARTTVVLAVGMAGAALRIEVTDESEMPISLPAPPEPPVPADDPFDEPSLAGLDEMIEALATTGRGMELVASIAARWGVTAHAEGGKTVWAEIGLGPALAQPGGEPGGAAAGASANRSLAAGSPEPGAVSLGDTPVTAGEAVPVAGSRLVRLVAVPLRLIVESDRIFDDTARELQVIALSHDAAPDVVRLAEVTTRLLDELGALRFSTQEAVRGAQRRGDRLVDLHLVAGPKMPDHLDRLDTVLRSLAAARSTGALLAMAPPSEVVAFRRWYRNEVLRQLDGRPLQPCPFPVSAPDHVRADPAPLSARRLALIDQLERDIGAAGDREEAAALASRWVVSEAGAAFVNLLMVEPDRDHVAVVYRVGYSADETEGRRYPVTHDNPISEVIRTAEPIVLRTPEERIARYPRLVVSAPLRANPTAVWVPLGTLPPADGCLVVGFGRARDFNARDLRFLQSLAAVVHRRLSG